MIPEASHGVPPARVLVIDDEAQIRRFLEISLRAQGYRIVESLTDAAALLAPRLVASGR